MACAKIDRAWGREAVSGERDEDVGGLEVSMHDALPVEVLNAREDVREELEGDAWVEAVT